MAWCRPISSPWCAPGRARSALTKSDRPHVGFDPKRTLPNTPTGACSMLALSVQIMSGISRLLSHGAVRDDLRAMCISLFRVRCPGQSEHRGFCRRAPFRTCKMDLLRRTSSILISYRHGPLLDAYLSVMKRRIQVQEEATTWGLWSSCARPLGTKSQPALKSIDPTTKDSRERRRRSFVRAAARTIYSRQSGLGWSTRSPKVRTTALLRSLLPRSFTSGAKRSNPIHEPFRSPSAMLLRGTPLA